MGAAGSMVSNFVVGLVMGSSMNLLWSMLNGLQLVVHLPLFFTPFPANANYFVDYLIDIATFEACPEEILNIFDFPVTESYNLAFQSTGYESMFAIGNLRTSVLMMNFWLLFLVLWIVLGICAIKCAKSRNWLANFVFYSMILRLFFESYLETSLSVFVGLTNMVWDSDNPSLTYNNIVTIVCTVILLALPIFIVTFYYCHIDNLTDETFNRKFGNIYDGMIIKKTRKSRAIALFYPFLFIFRRLVFAFVCVVD